ncbi:hypothetical protein F4678DRAFT_464249 [Xylaria arbuscula]|nr:hypothetical protein F4678DRAFT_464249 [Xylaria arbuscula]
MAALDQYRNRYEQSSIINTMAASENRLGDIRKVYNSELAQNRALSHHEPQPFLPEDAHGVEGWKEDFFTEKEIQALDVEDNNPFAKMIWADFRDSETKAEQTRERARILMRFRSNPNTFSLRRNAFCFLENEDMWQTVLEGSILWVEGSRQDDETGERYHWQGGDHAILRVLYDAEDKDAQQRGFDELQISSEYTFILATINRNHLRWKEGFLIVTGDSDWRVGELGWKYMLYYTQQEHLRSPTINSPSKEYVDCSHAEELYEQMLVAVNHADVGAEGSTSRS